VLDARLEPGERLARLTNRAIGAAFCVLLVSSGAMVVVQGGLLAWTVLLAALALGGALAAAWWTRERLTRRRAAAEASYLRLLRELSRSASPDAVVIAIVDELRETSGADHVVVTRVRPGDRLLEAVLFSATGDAPPGTTYLPATTLAGGRPAQIAERIVAQLRDAYGLRNALAVPLVAPAYGGRPAQVVGSLTLSRRKPGPWPIATRELLGSAAIEVATALVRVYAFQAAETMASLDGLTGLPNRRHFDDLGRALARGRRGGDRLGLLMIDIDHFKRLNDRYGHQTGDAVLQAVARAIAASVRAEDTPARYGGEEFAVVLRRPTPVQAVDVAQRIRSAVAALPLSQLAVDGPVTVSIGVALGIAPAEPLASLVERADRALFQAKRRGRDRVVVDGQEAPARHVTSQGQQLEQLSLVDRDLVTPRTPTAASRLNR
jgi:diguanylate cyclase (GGDEF)-like protein